MSVSNINYNPFIFCQNLTSIIVEEGNVNYDSRNNCNAIIETSTNTLISGCKNTIILNSISRIGNYAFYGCSGLTSITIPNSVTNIGDYAFSKFSDLASVISLNPTPPTCGTNVFYNVSVGDITLEVPSESVSLYQSADTWKDFGTIKAVTSASRSESSGIDDVFADGDEVEYFTLQGVKVVNPAHGLYIRKQGNKVTKVVL